MFYELQYSTSVLAVEHPLQASVSDDDSTAVFNSCHLPKVGMRCHKNAKKVLEMHACRHLGNPRRVVRIPGDLAFTSAENTDKNVDHRCTPGTCVFDMRVVDAQEK